MFEIPLYIFLFIYFGILVIFFIFSMVNFYHIISTASFTMASFVTTFIIFGLTILTVYFTWYLLLEIDWKTMVPLFNRDWFNGVLIF